MEGLGFVFKAILHGKGTILLFWGATGGGRSVVGGVFEEGKNKVSVLGCGGVLIPCSNSTRTGGTVTRTTSLTTTNRKTGLCVISIYGVISTVDGFSRMSVTRNYLATGLSRSLRTRYHHSLGRTTTVIPRNITRRAIFRVNSPKPIVLDVTRSGKYSLVIVKDEKLNPLGNVFVKSISDCVMDQNGCPILVMGWFGAQQ